MASDGFSSIGEVRAEYYATAELTEGAAGSMVAEELRVAEMAGLALQIPADVEALVLKIGRLMNLVEDNEAGHAGQLNATEEAAGRYSRVGQGSNRAEPGELAASSGRLHEEVVAASQENGRLQGILEGLVQRIVGAQPDADEISVGVAATYMTVGVNRAEAFRQVRLARDIADGL